MNVASPSALYVDGGANVERNLLVGAWLTGSADLTWHQFNGAFSGPNLRITCPTNTFTGQWIVDQGALVGVAGLGTNNIFVGAFNANYAALEPLYDMESPDATLVLGQNGKVFLHQNLWFGRMMVNGMPVADGVYSAAELNNLYPGSFPALWQQQTGSTFNSIYGSIKVGSGITPIPTPPNITEISMSGTTLSITAKDGAAGGSWTLLQSTDLALPVSQWSPAASGTFDGGGNLSLNIPNLATNQQCFYLLKVQ